jgi:hypothetical protein
MKAPRFSCEAEKGPPQSLHQEHRRASARLKKRAKYVGMGEGSQDGNVKDFTNIFFVGV